MNTHNHHRILNEVKERLYKEALSDKNLVKVAREFFLNFESFIYASDYSDNWSTSHDADAFFFYNFYYDIELDSEKQKSNGTILLKRSKEGNYKNSYLNCDLGDNKIPSQPSKFKCFFSILNNREYWLKDDFFDKSNQSDCVAFLHAMAASVKHGDCILTESEGAAKREFIKHLKKCFAEYLLLRDDKEATIMLGIALHGIMDSFTPSHMDFQPYAIQDMALHAQGDVIPFRNDIVHFEPGQYTEDGKASKGKSKLAAKFIKHYNGDDHISDIEFEMFKIFTVIGAINNNKKIQEILDGADLSRMTEKYNSKRYRMENVVEPRSLQRLKDIIKENNIEYGEDAFIYSDAAITVCKDVFVTLSKAKLGIGSYEDYKRKKNEKEKVIEIESKKEKVTVIEESINIWETKYKELAQKREELFKNIREIRNFSDKEKEEKKNPFAE